MGSSFFKQKPKTNLQVALSKYLFVQWWRRSVWNRNLIIVVCLVLKASVGTGLWAADLLDTHRSIVTYEGVSSLETLYREHHARINQELPTFCVLFLAALQRF